MMEPSTSCLVARAAMTGAANQAPGWAVNSSRDSLNCCSAVSAVSAVSAMSRARRGCRSAMTWRARREQDLQQHSSPCPTGHSLQAIPYRRQATGSGYLTPGSRSVATEKKPRDGTHADFIMAVQVVMCSRRKSLFAARPAANLHLPSGAVHHEQLQLVVAQGAVNCKLPKQTPATSAVSTASTVLRTWYTSGEGSNSWRGPYLLVDSSGLARRDRTVSRLPSAVPGLRRRRPPESCATSPRETAVAMLMVWCGMCGMVCVRCLPSHGPRCRVSIKVLQALLSLS